MVATLQRLSLMTSVTTHQTRRHR
jgi:hypothetical protein